MHVPHAVDIVLVAGIMCEIRKFLNFQPRLGDIAINLFLQGKVPVLN
jgi:hypothetical protein